MKDYVVNITGPDAKAHALECLNRAPDGFQVVFRKDARSTAQNRKMWGDLARISVQVKHPITGKSIPKEWWKYLFMHELGLEQQVMPAIDGQAPVYIGRSSRDLSKETMSALLELIAAFAAKHGVELQE